MRVKLALFPVSLLQFLRPLSGETGNEAIHIKVDTRSLFGGGGGGGGDLGMRLHAYM